MIFQVVDKSKRIDEIPEWFRGSRLNYAENMLRCNDDRVAIYAASKQTLRCTDTLSGLEFRKMSSTVIRSFFAVVNAFFN
jgi:hypothetical protein